MDKPSSVMMPHRVTITKNAWSTDVDGGRYAIPSLARVIRDVPAFVQQGRSKTLVETGDETGLRQVQEQVLTRIFFSTDVRLSEHDVVTHSDGSGVAHSYVVTGYHEPGVMSVFWQAEAEESR